MAFHPPPRYALIRGMSTRKRTMWAHPSGSSIVTGMMPVTALRRTIHHHM
jgi:hypothetical protein